MRGHSVLARPINTPSGTWARETLTAIWFHQFATLQHRFIRYCRIQRRGLEPLCRLSAAFGRRVRIRVRHPPPATWGGLPAPWREPDTNKTLKQMLEDLLPGQRFEIVPRVSNINAGIQATRKAMRGAYIDEEHCARASFVWTTTRSGGTRWLGPGQVSLHDDNSHGSDAFRQWGQTVEAADQLCQARPETFKRRGSGWRSDSVQAWHPARPDSTLGPGLAIHRSHKAHQTTPLHGDIIGHLYMGER